MEIPTSRNENKSFYQSVHYWIKHNYGKANKCENIECPEISRNYDWAKKKGKSYDYKRVNFIMLCHSCHKKYDMTDEFREKQRKARKGKRLPDLAYVNFIKNRKGKPRPKEVGEKVSKALMGKPQPWNWKAVYQFDMSGKFIRKYNSVTETKKDGFCDNGVSQCCIGNYKSSGGYKWSFDSALQALKEKLK